MNATKSQFNETLKREGRTITCHNQEIKCFFRKNPEEMSIRDSVILYYPKDAAIDCGNIYQYRNCHYLIMNKETAENDVYCKSHAVRCNGFIRNLTTPMEKTYIYCSGLLNTLAAQDTFLSIIDGNTVFQTEANEESRKAQINDKFNQFGRTWQIQNIYEIDGILHLSCQIVEDVEEVYTVEFINDVSDNYYVGDIVNITACAKINGIVCTDAQLSYRISGGNIIWLSNSDNLKTIRLRNDSITVRIVATLDGNVFEMRHSITVNEIPAAITATISGADQAYAGLDETYTLSVMQGTSDITSKVSGITWAFVGNYYNSKLTPVADNPAQAVLRPDSSSAVGKTLTIQATVTYNGSSVSTTKSVLAKGLF